jgi:hypothetical protein
MSDKKPEAGWLARRREKQRLKRERTGDSAEKLEQRHTNQGKELAAKDAAMYPKGGAPGDFGGAGGMAG